VKIRCTSFCCFLRPIPASSLQVCLKRQFFALIQTKKSIENAIVSGLDLWKAKCLYIDRAWCRRDYAMTPSRRTSKSVTWPVPMTASHPSGLIGQAVRALVLSVASPVIEPGFATSSRTPVKVAPSPVIGCFNVLKLCHFATDRN